MSTQTPLGVTFGSLAVLGPRAVMDIAQTAAAMNYRSLWTVEANGTDAFSLLGAVSAVAPKLDLATGIVPVQVRTPPLPMRFPHIGSPAVDVDADEGWDAERSDVRGGGEAVRAGGGEDSAAHSKRRNRRHLSLISDENFQCRVIRVT